MGEMTNVNRILVGKTERKDLGLGGMVILNFNFKEMGYGVWSEFI